MRFYSLPCVLHASPVLSSFVWFGQSEYVQWTQNSCEFQLRHWKREREGGKGKGEQDGKESVWACLVKLKTFFPLLISTQSLAFSYTNFHNTLYKH
jgi:hypothetical protein